MSLTCDALRDFVVDELGVDPNSVTEDALLFSSGLVDSFALITLMMHIENQCGFLIPPTEVKLENFDSISRMLKFIELSTDKTEMQPETQNGRAVNTAEKNGSQNYFEERMASVASSHGTPLYVYDADLMLKRFDLLDQLFGRHFGVSYAVKANPNVELLRHIRPKVTTFDVSSFKEVERVLLAGGSAEKITFSGPAKRDAEIRAAVTLGVGELVLESLAEAKAANFWAGENSVRQSVLIRINPAEGPKYFGVSFSGRASQFGIDEEVLEDAITRVQAFPNLKLIGFHIYSGTNSLNPQAIAENFAIFIRLFRRAAQHAGIEPEKLVFGSGFGLSYGEANVELDIHAVASAVLPMMDEFKSDPQFACAACVLELGRWLVGPAGWLLTSVVSEKNSRGREFRACDAGFNNHLAACGMMGTVIAHNWNLKNISNPEGPEHKYTLVGPLCTSIDVLATDITLPEVRVGDVIAVENSGAYGLTASPTRFISHPEPAEIVLSGNQIIDATESAANHWTQVDVNGRLKAGRVLEPAAAG